MTRLDVQKVRADFPILDRVVNGKPLVYLDSGASSQRPLRVIEAMDEFWREHNANVHRGVHRLSQEATNLYEKARERTKVFLNAESTKQIIFTKGCTEAINLVARSYARPLLKAGDRILVSTMEHHSNIVPWQLVAEEVGAEVIPIPITDAGEIDLDAYHALLDERVKVVGIVAISNSLGTINPIQEMIRDAHAVGAVVLVDGAQAGLHMRIDVQALDADFLTLSCHKMLAPTGVGVLYGKPEHLQAMPPYQGGGDMIRTVSFEKTTYAELPSKFEAGTPNIGGVVGLGAAIEYIASFGGPEFSPEALDRAFELISAHEQELLVYGTEKLLAIPGLKMTGTAKHKAGILAFTLDFAHPHDVGTILDSEGVAIRTGHHCCQPLMKRLGVPATARASLAPYNTIEEIDALVAALHRVAELFGN